MNRNLIISTIVLIAGGVFISLFAEGNWQWIWQVLGFFFVLSPILWYWLKLARKQDKGDGLSDTEIDSVYYLGFLITIITLAVTILYIGLDDGILKHTHKIISQFGCGLLATGLALFARLHLLSKEGVVKRLDPEQKTQMLAWKIVELTGQFDGLGKKIGNLAANGESLIKTFDVAETQFHQRLDKAAKLFEQSTQAIVERSEARERLLAQAGVEFNEKLAQLSRESLDKTAAAIAASTEKFGAGIDRLLAETDRLQTETQALSFKQAALRLEEYSKTMETSLGAINAAVNKASQESAEAINKLTATAWETQAMAVEIGSNINSLKSLDMMVAQIGKAADSAQIIAATAPQSGDRLAALADRAQAASEEINASLKATLALLDAVGRKGDGQGLHGTLDKTTQELQMLTRRIQEVAQVLAEAKAQLQPTLTSIAQTGTGLGARKITPPF